MKINWLSAFKCGYREKNKVTMSLLKAAITKAILSNWLQLPVSALTGAEVTEGLGLCLLLFVISSDDAAGRGAADYTAVSNK